jgi:hypothetical protein
MDVAIRGVNNNRNIDIVSTELEYDAVVNRLWSAIEIKGVFDTDAFKIEWRSLLAD